jgi:stress response protein YsnF
MEQTQQYEGKTVLDNAGQKIGTISQVFVDQQTQRPEWGLIHTGLFGGRSTFAPLVAGEWDQESLVLPYTKDHVKGAPNLEENGQLSIDAEAELARYYGLDYSTSDSATGIIAGGQTRPAAADGGGENGDDSSGSTTDGAMTRSEERMTAGVVRRPSELVRLNKSVVSEPVSQTVPVQREDVEVSREPITDANREAATSGPEISEEQHEMTVMQEEAVAEKRVEPVERVRLDKQVSAGEQELSGEVRKEQIEVERQPQS